MLDYGKLITFGIIATQEYMLHAQHNRIKFLETKLESYQEQVSYLCSILNKNKIQLDEFDYIALPNVTSIRREINTD